MWKLIERNFGRENKLLYWLDVILAIYVIGTGLASHYEMIIAPIDYIRSLGTGIYVITEMMLILTAVNFAGKKTQDDILKDNSRGASVDKIFWSKISVLGLNYLNLVIVAFISTLFVDKLVFKNKFLNVRNLHTMMISVGSNFLLVFLIVSATIIFSVLVKSLRGALACGIGVQYLGSALDAPFMILLYHHQWLKWNPFNCFFVQYQINNPINHTMTKLSMADCQISTIFYGLIYLAIAYFVFYKLYQKYVENHA